jgi:23S rRNA A1618 N6-methylase RlmF
VVRILTLLFGLMSLHSYAWATTFTATVDRAQLSQEEHIILTLSLMNSDIRLRAEGANPNIDLSVLTN